MSGRIWTQLVVIAVLVVACSNNEGTLVPVIDLEGEVSGFGEFSNGTDKSFGLFVCTEGGSVQLESVEPASIEGSIEMLGAMVYTEETGGRFVGAVHGYPPAGLEETQLVSIEGAVIESDCDAEDAENQIQIVVGAERTGPEGGQIDGLIVNTSTGPVDVDYGILLCGDDLEYCESLAPSEEDA